ncbi:MAG: DNA polymerase I [Sandaracinaceae bacterium]
MARERVVLIDGSSMIYRAFFAIPSNFHTADGLHTNATYGFALMFRKILAGRKPTLGAVVFDPPGPTFRDKKYPAYKAQRPKMAGELRQQLPWIHKLVDVYDFPTVTVEGFEADDVIGTLTRQALGAGHEVHIISADKDFAQLIGPHVRMIDTMRDITYDEALVKKKWGVPPGQIVDLLALTGDKVDNVPGVPGIGQKGAAQLLEKYGDLASILAHVDELKGRKKTGLTEHRDDALLSQDLVTIDQHATLPLTLDELRIPEPDLDAIDGLYRELEFFSLLSGGEGGPEAESAESDFAAFETVDALRAWLGQERAGPVACHVVRRGTSRSGSPVAVAFSDAPHVARLARLEGEGALGEGALETVSAFLSDAKAPKVVHGLRDLMTLFAGAGVAVDGVVADTKLASFLIDPSKVVPHRIDQVIREYLHRAVPADKSVLGSGKKARTFEAVPLDELTPFVCNLAACIAEMAPVLTARMQEAEQASVFETLSMPMATVLAAMQHEGVRVDVARLAALQAEFGARKAAVEARIYELAGSEFNIGSTKQLAKVLFEDLGLPVIKRTKTGYSTAADVLERLAKEHDICAEILRQRALAKLINTYTQVLVDAVDPATDRVHCTLQQTSGVSGRLITTDPDLQRTPIRTEDGKRIREAFVPRDGWVFVSADWSQIELRVLAHVSEEPRLIEAFTENVDVHRRTAAQIFDVPAEEVDDHQRNVGKTVNFATIYGQGATALGQQLGIPRKEAKAYIDRYFERHPRVREWLDRTVQEAHERGYVTTLAGRRRQIPELRSNNFNDRGYGERIAANTPIQGSAADLCKRAMLSIADALQSRGMQAKMLLQIHDELLFECPPAEVDALLTLVRESMEMAVSLKVPLVVDIGHGASWAEAKA